MAVFATEAAVRLQVQIDDVNVASAALVAACIDEAHERVLAELAPSVDTNDPADAVVQGETLLAAAGVMRALASRDAADQVELQVGGQRIDAGQRFASLMSMARRFEKESRSLLAPYGATKGAAAPVTVTPSVPVIGGGPAD